MSSSRHLGIAILMLVLIVGVGGLLLVWPVYRESAGIDLQVQVLNKKAEQDDVQAEEIAKLTTSIETLNHQIDTGLKIIPESSDIAGLMRALSLPVDDVHVRDQTFTAGPAREAVVGTNLTTRVQPLTVELESRFDAVFALMRAAESMDRLLRISSVKIACDRRLDEDQPFARASIVLEVVFNPSEEEF